MKAFVLRLRLLLKQGCPADGLHAPRTVMNAAQHIIVNLFETLLSFITKLYYLDMYIFYINDHKWNLLDDIKRLSKGLLHN